MLILLHGGTTWTLTKRMEKKLDGNCTKMLRTVQKSPGGNIPQRSNYTYRPSQKHSRLDEQDTTGHCWISKGELIGDELLWTPSHGRAKVEWPARTYLPQLCTDRECSLEDLPSGMEVRNEWQEKFREIHARGRPWWSVIQVSIPASEI